MKDTTVRGGIVYDTSLICGDPNGVCVRNYIPIREATIADYIYAEWVKNTEIDEEQK